MRILGIDPGLNTTGYGVVEVGADRRLRLCEAGIIRGRTRGSLTARVEEIHSGVADALALALCHFYLSRTQAAMAAQ